MSYIQKCDEWIDYLDNFVNFLDFVDESYVDSVFKNLFVRVQNECRDIPEIDGLIIGMAEYVMDIESLPMDKIEALYNIQLIITAFASCKRRLQKEEDKENTTRKILKEGHDNPFTTESIDIPRGYFKQENFWDLINRFGGINYDLLKEFKEHDNKNYQVRCPTYTMLYGMEDWEIEGNKVWADFHHDYGGTHTVILDVTVLSNDEGNTDEGC